MNSFTRFALLLCLTLVTSAVSYSARAATIDEQTAARFDALEKENAAREIADAITARHKRNASPMNRFIVRAPRKCPTYQC